MDELKCSHCGEPIEEEDESYQLEDGSVICSNCYDDEYSECELCGKITLIDDMTYWGDCRICPDCLEDQCPAFDEEEVKKATAEAYEAFRNRTIGKKTAGLIEGENYLTYEDSSEPAISYEFFVTVDGDGIITDVTRLSAQMLLSEGATSSEWRPYPIDECDYSDIADEVLEDYLIDSDEDDEEDEEDEEETGDIEWDDYCDYPFAMEVVNGEIISLKATLQIDMRSKLLQTSGISEESLIAWLLGEDAESDVSWLDENCCHEQDELAEILGFDAEESAFRCEDIDFLSSSYGWEAKELLELLGYPLKEAINHGPHGHGTTGVIYLRAED